MGNKLYQLSTSAPYNNVKTTGTDFPASFPDIYLTFDTNGQHSPDYDKRDDFNFVIIKFPPRYNCQLIVS
jgi:hypothetical protein